VSALFERALAGPPKKKVERALAPNFKTDGPFVRALFERALAGPPKKKVERAPKKGTPVAEVKKG
jgi:hypothetical protein